ncbi:LysR family transcriptional regulator [Rhodococcus opacus]|uniref:LysR family transcriptional regulator n=1 Tax=Rhodococcus opacus TaxID=37919 RepID=A0A2S8J2E5_RHOOP|nr:LysR family transcriptional regulator [Rhodococcus opacus]PQP21137.1 LysR family transcriptional regulator [Rhodococcus opacus]
MEFRQVALFLAVVENDGLNGAATALGVAQPTVSHALRSLERDLGVRLFHRVGRGLVLTAAGRSLIGPSRQLLRDVHAVQELLALPDDDVAGSLDLMVFPALATGPIVELVARFCEAHPRATVRFADLRREENATSVIRDGHCEFVVAHLPVEDGGGGLEVIELGTQEYWLVYPPGTELPAGPIAWSALPDIPMVFVPRVGGSVSLQIENAMQQAGVHPPVAVLNDQREARLPMVLAGVGGSVVERTLAESVRDVAVARPSEPRFTRSFGVIYDPTSLTKAGRAFVDMLRGVRRQRIEGPVCPETVAY